MTKLGFSSLTVGFALAIIGCGGGNGGDDQPDSSTTTPGKFSVAVDGTGLDTTDRARVAKFLLRVDMDDPPVSRTLNFAAGAFDDGIFEFEYTPTLQSGSLTLVLSAQDAAGGNVATSSATGEIRPGMTTTLVINLTGTPMNAVLVVDPAVVDFGNVSVGAAAGRTSVTLRNSGGAATGPLTATLSGDSTFVIDPATSCDGRILMPSDTCMLTLEFRPTVAGARTGKLDVVAAPGGTVSADLLGTGVTAPVLMMTPTVVDMGDVQVGSMGPPITMMVMNTGGGASGTVTVTKGGTDAADLMVTTDGCNAQPLAGGATCMITLRFQPMSPGAKSAMLTVSANPGGTQTSVLAGRGLNAALLTITPTTQDYGTVVTGNMSDATFTIRNLGEVTSGNIIVTIEGANFDEFPQPPGTDNCTGSTLAFNAQCVVTVRFQPVTVGPKNAIVRVRAAPGGDINATITGTAAGPGALTITPTSINFGAVTAGGMSTTQVFTIRNTGGASTGALNVSLGGSSANQFFVVSDGCSTMMLAPAGTCTISYQLRPTTPGGKTASLVVTANPGGTATASLTGQGLASARLQGNATTANMGTADVNTLGTSFTWTVSNVGDLTTGTLTTTTTGDSVDFIVSGNCTSTLGVGASCQITVVFAPKSGGSKSATITVSGTPGGSVMLVANGVGRPLQLLSVTKSGTGGGTVTSSPGGINCGSDCSEGYLFGTNVTLTPMANVGSQFAGWSGACTGTGACVVNMSNVADVNAIFNLQRFTLTVTTSGVSTGTVTSNTGGINCGATCSATYDYNTMVTLTAMAANNYSFGGWSGACSGTASTCMVTMTQARTVSATFTINQYALSITLAGTGTGTVTSSPAGINCGTDCGEAYNANTPVMLTAAPGGGQGFTGWTAAGGTIPGTCTGTTSPCTITMSQAQSLTATFTPMPRTLTVTIAGMGTGSVSSAPAGIDNCTTGSCVVTLPHGTAVTLTATNNMPSSVLGAWSGGGCTGNGATCNLTLNSNTTVTKTFNKAPVTLTVTKTGAAATPGRVDANNGPVDCGATCTGSYLYGDIITLTETHGSNYFLGWSDACSTAGLASTCMLTLTAATTTVGARFEQPQTVTYTDTSPMSTGTVSWLPTGADCSNDCTRDFPSNTMVTLTATPDVDSVFVMWGAGACITFTTTPVCTISLGTADVSAEAIFAKK